MREQFEQYLIAHGYRQTTPGGSPSTVYDYLKRIDRICQWEAITWQELAQNIQAILPQYDVGGAKEALGVQSHHAVINALRRFAEFSSL